MRYVDKKDFICTYHNYILEDIKKLKKILDTEDELINDLLDGMLECAKYAKKAGQRMELRLYKYRDTIESLGFKRSKKTNTKKRRCS
jgi:hypothetical protein